MAVKVQIADDVAGFVHEQSKLQGVPFESYLDAMLRKAIVETESSVDSGAQNAEPFTYEPFSSGFLPGVDVENPRRYADDLEIEELRLKMGIEDPS